MNRMRKYIRNLSITWKLKLIIMTASAITLALASICFIVADIIAFRNTASRNLSYLTNVIGHGVLGLDDKNSAEKSITALNHMPWVVCATILDGNGNKYASFVREGAQIPPWDDIKPGAHFRGKHMLLYQPIMLEDVRIGAVFVQYDLAELFDKVRQYGLIFSSIIILALFVALMLSSPLQRFVSEPVLNLAETARKIAREKDYSVRAQKCMHDELGVLCEDFNSMLSEIQSREEELKSHRGHLEEEVDKRTEELENANRSLEKRTEELQKANEELLKAKEEADTANRAKSEFLANMSHEIRTPMNAVLGFTEILGSLITDPNQKSYLHSIESGGKNLLTLINDILDLSKIEAGKMEIRNEPVDPVSIMEDIRGVFSLKISEKELDFIADFDSDIPRGLVLDEVRLRQVLFNLIGNAIKFTDKGYIKLSLEKRRADEKAGIMDLVVSVEDTGIGISSESANCIFEAFRQQDGQSAKRFGGTGLGLAITKRLVELMGGTIRVESEIGRGSRFEIYFKNVVIDEIPNAAVADASVDAERIVFGKATVLIVDDIESNRDLLKAFFHDTNIAVLEAGDGEKAVMLAKNRLPDLILMDIRMPFMDGCEATQMIRSVVKNKRIPIIALTASGMKSDRERLMCCAFEGFLTKPVKRTVLFRELARFLEHTVEDGIGEESADEQATESGELKDLSDIIHRLENEFLNTWISIKETGFFEDIATFAENMAVFGEQSDMKQIRDYGRDLRSGVDAFDVEKINTVLVSYPDFVKGIRAMQTKESDA